VSQGNAVGTVMAADWAVQGSNPAMARHFLFSKTGQTGSGAHQPHT